MVTQSDLKRKSDETPLLKNKSVIEGPESRAFCAATLTSGAQVRIVGDTPGEFIETLKGASVAWVDFSVKDISKDSEWIATSFGFSGSLISTLLSGHYSAYEDLDTELGLMLPGVRIQKLEVKIYPILILVRRGLILTIHEKEIVRFARFCRYAETIMKKFPASATITDKVSMLLSRILDENNERNFDGLRHLEDQADELSAMLMDPKTPRDLLGPEIYRMKHSLITYLDTLWATMDVVNFLRFGDAEIMTDNAKILQRVEFLANDIERKISLGEHMSEVLASGLEVLQTIYNNQLQILNNRLTIVNNRLAMLAAWLAIIGTAVLVPNTIATIFGIPYLPINTNLWPLILGILIISTMWAAWVTYMIVRKKGWVIPVEGQLETAE